MGIDKIYTPRGVRVVDDPRWYGGGYELTTGRGAVNKAYIKSAWAFACMNIRGTELSNLPWQLTKNGKTVENHDIITMLNTFGIESNYAETIVATEIDLLMFGKAFWLIDGDILQRLAANTISIKSNRSGIQEFTQTIQGTIVNKFNRDEIVYFREYNPDSDLDAGIAVNTVIKPATDLEKESNDYIIALIKNNATPAFVISTDQDVPQEELNRLVTWFNQTFKGAKKAGKVAGLSRGLTVKTIALDMEKMAMVKIRDQARSDICVGYRVPKLLVGSMEDATYANAQEARKFFIEDFVIPRGEYYADVINSDLIRRIDPSVTFEFLPEQLQIFQEDSSRIWGRLNSAIKAGVISVEFAREQMGWPEFAAPEEVFEVDTTLRSWKRKAKKALKRGENPNVPFETDEVPARLQLAIRSSLESASSTREIDKVFHVRD
ncbi:hypothetical protein LCGC14_1214080 [marine sediment metagenome]|uniref:Phage portal protein n=1 Tax=marine sediment metagenome TaxID=412755 RepID=A0A0F9LHD6_9ZZZZ